MPACSKMAPLITEWFKGEAGEARGSSRTAQLQHGNVGPPPFHFPGALVIAGQPSPEPWVGEKSAGEWEHRGPVLRAPWGQEEAQ